MLILASKSPRRKELLSLTGYEYIIDPAVGDEALPEKISPANAVELLSRQKADEVFSRHSGDVVLAADTVVALDDIILGKPKNRDDAFRMLEMLSGRVHSVFTGVCIKSKSDIITFFEETKVEFFPLSASEINDYINTGEPFDKAGAYGIQEKGGLLVKRIEGDFFNVVGLPVSRVNRELGKLIF